MRNSRRGEEVWNVGNSRGGAFWVKFQGAVILFFLEISEGPFWVKFLNRGVQIKIASYYTDDGNIN